jgi:DegV family protein with EDD domain
MPTKVAVVADSTCDTPPDWPGRRRLHLIPIHIRFGNQSFREGVDIDEAGFYARVESEHLIPQTSQPSPGEFAELYTRLSRDYDAILSLHVTGRLSGTYQSALLGAELVRDTVPVYPFDSACGSAGLGFMVDEALTRLDAGHSIEQVLARLTAIRERMNILLTPATLKYAQMSGRISALGAAMASVLQVKPIVMLREGQLHVGERVRTRARALERMVGILKERLGDTAVRVAVVHAQSPAEAAELIAKVKATLNGTEVWLTSLATSIAVHLGPGTVGLVAYPP